MSFGAPAAEAQQPSDFAFTADNLDRAKAIIGKYPDGRQQSALLPLLDLAQRQNDNWLPRAAMNYVAELLEVPPIRAYEVASFYTMFNKAPVGRHFVQVCTTTPCWLCGSNDVLKALKDKTGAGPGENSADGAFTIVEVECLGACVNAPMVQINDDYYEDLDYQRMGQLIDLLAKGETPKIGSQIGRKGSQALSGPTSLLEPPKVVIVPEAKAKKAPAKAKATKAEADDAKAGGTKGGVESADVSSDTAEAEAVAAKTKPRSKAKATAKPKPKPKPDAPEVADEVDPAENGSPPAAKDEG